LTLGLFAGPAVHAAPVARPAPAPKPAQNTAVTDARKRVAEAQQAVNDIKAEQQRIKDKKRAEFETKEEWKNTVATDKKAKAAYEAARKSALTALQNKPEYKQLIKDRETLQKTSEALSKQKDPDPTAISRNGTAMATKGIAIKNMEKDAQERDEKVLEAKDALDAAAKNMKALDDEVEGSLATDPDYMALQTQLDQAEQQLAQAKQSLADAQKAAIASRPKPAPRPAKSYGRGASGE
jgi:hypothetical protein